MTRILFLIDELDVGGTEQQLLELVKRLELYSRRFAPADRKKHGVYPV